MHAEGLFAGSADGGERGAGPRGALEHRVLLAALVVRTILDVNFVQGTEELDHPNDAYKVEEEAQDQGGHVHDLCSGRVVLGSDDVTNHLPVPRLGEGVRGWSRFC